jgi:hypothetical protein
MHMHFKADFKRGRMPDFRLNQSGRPPDQTKPSRQDLRIRAAAEAFDVPKGDKTKSSTYRWMSGQLKGQVDGTPAANIPTRTTG